jgi:hypothetical protein
MAIFWVRKGEMKEHALAERAEAFSRSAGPMSVDGDDSGMVFISRESIGSMSAADIGDELSREQYIANAVDEHATDLMRKQFAQKANGMQVKWLLQVVDVSAPDSNGTIRAALSMPYRISRGSGWGGSSVSVRAEFAEDAVDALMKVRREQWVTVAGELQMDSDGRGVRLLGARVVE